MRFGAFQPGISDKLNDEAAAPASAGDAQLAPEVPEPEVVDDIIDDVIMSDDVKPSIPEVVADSIDEIVNEETQTDREREQTTIVTVPVTDIDSVIRENEALEGQNEDDNQENESVASSTNDSEVRKNGSGTPDVVLTKLEPRTIETDLDRRNAVDTKSETGSLDTISSTGDDEAQSRRKKNLEKKPVRLSSDFIIWSLI